MKRQASDLFDDIDFSENETVSPSGGAFTDEPLFDFNFAPLGPRRHWRNVVERTQYRAELQINSALLTA